MAVVVVNCCPNSFRDHQARLNTTKNHAHNNKRQATLVVPLGYNATHERRVPPFIRPRSRSYDGQHMTVSLDNSANEETRFPTRIIILIRRDNKIKKRRPHRGCALSLHVCAFQASVPTSEMALDYVSARTPRRTATILVNALKNAGDAVERQNNKRREA